MILAPSTMERLLKKSGAERVSKDAKHKMAEVLEEVAEKIGKKALRLSSHAGRKTLRACDIIEATKD